MTLRLYYEFLENKLDGSIAPRLGTDGSGYLPYLKKKATIKKYLQMRYKSSYNKEGIMGANVYLGSDKGQRILKLNKGDFK